MATSCTSHTLVATSGSSNLDMGMTLENLIPDEDEEFYKLGMSEDFYLHAIYLYFNDDLTEVYRCGTRDSVRV